MAVKYMRRSDGTTGSIPQNIFVTMRIPVAGDAVDQNAWVCPTSEAYELVSVSEVHTTASTSGTLTVQKCTGTTAPGSGTALLSATVSLAGAANTVLTGTLSATRSDRIFAAGDRLALDFGGTVTNYVNGIITIALKRLQSSSDTK